MGNVYALFGSALRGRRRPWWVRAGVIAKNPEGTPTGIVGTVVLPVFGVMIAASSVYRSSRLKCGGLIFRHHVLGLILPNHALLPGCAHLRRSPASAFFVLRRRHTVGPIFFDAGGFGWSIYGRRFSAKRNDIVLLSSSGEWQQCPQRVTVVARPGAVAARPRAPRFVYRRRAPWKNWAPGLQALDIQCGRCPRWRDGAEAGRGVAPRAVEGPDILLPPVLKSTGIIMVLAGFTIFALLDESDAPAEIIAGLLLIIVGYAAWSLGLEWSRRRRIRHPGGI